MDRTDASPRLEAILGQAGIPVWIGLVLLPLLILLLTGCGGRTTPPAVATLTREGQPSFTPASIKHEAPDRLSQSTEQRSAPVATETPAGAYPLPIASETPAGAYPPLIASEPPETVYFPVIVNTLPTQTPTATPGPTRTPAPTPTPTPPWPEPLEKPGQSKLGLHVEWNNSPDIMEFIRRTKPAVVKAAGDLGFLAEVKEVSPSTITVARLAQGPQKLEGDPVQVARHFVAKNLEQYQLNPAVDYWEGWNEPNVRGRMARYAAFEAERARLMAEHGFRVAVGAFSAGVPEWEVFAEFLPAIEAAQKYDGIFTVHEYDAPTLNRSMGAGLPGRPAHPERGALALRYRWWYEDFLKPRGLVVPLVISEAGIDGGIGDRIGPGGRGWRDFKGYWETHKLGDDSVKTYVGQLAWYDAEVREDDYVIGFAVFTAGVISEQWKSFDITPHLREIATYVVSQH